MRTQLFEALKEVNRRPEPFAEYTARELWTDPHIAGRMLACHLDETVDAASRKPESIDRSVEWIVTHFDLAPGATVADFGCGPGLYAQRLARAGLKVTGIDFSANSLAYAREQAAREHLDIDYVHADYLTLADSLDLTACGPGDPSPLAARLDSGDPAPRRFDLILMIMCDFCALSPAQRLHMLRTFRALLAPEGSVLLDVYSPRMFEESTEKATYGPDLMDGFWSPNEYYGFLTTFKYPGERLVLDKYTVVERERTRCVYNWFQCFTQNEVEREFGAAGLRVVDYRGDVAGSPYNAGAVEFAVVAHEVEGT